MKNIKILLVGPAERYGRLAPYGDAFKSLGCEIAIIDTKPFVKTSFLNRAINRFVRIPVYFENTALTARLFSVAKEFEPDFIFFIKPIFFKKETFERLRNEGAILFSWYPDDIFYLKNISREFYKSISLFDCHFTTKSFNIGELMNAGAKKAVFLPHAVNSSCHYPIVTANEDQGKYADIVFVGTYAKDKRVSYLERLSEEGYDVRVCGEGWGRVPKGFNLFKCGQITGRAFYCEDLSRVFNNSKIVLAFLRAHNRDVQTSRTYEIPACGGFMLHERTREAVALFKEGEEAEFFGSYREMKEKIDYYLAHEVDRKRIAEAGYQRAIKEDYSYLSRAKEVLRVYGEIKKK